MLWTGSLLGYQHIHHRPGLPAVQASFRHQEVVSLTVLVGNPEA